MSPNSYGASLQAGEAQPFLPRVLASLNECQKIAAVNQEELKATLQRAGLMVNEKAELVPPRDGTLNEPQPAPLIQLERDLARLRNRLYDHHEIISQLRSQLLGA